MTELNFEQARFNMIEQQLRPWNIFDQGVLDQIQQLPRDEFVPAQYKTQAYTDINVPLGHGECMMPPKLEARMLQALKVQAQDAVLEVGTGSAYVTALLASMARHVYSVDIHQDFINQAQDKLARHHITNVTLECGDAARGWDQHKPYDVIAITGAMPVLPESFQKTLNVGGRLFAIVGDAPAREAVLITRVSDNEWSREVLFETDLPNLQNAPEPERFVL